MSGRRWALVGAVFGALLTSAVPAESFTATHSAMSVIAKMRAEARQLTAVRDRRTGALVYCPSVPEGWTYAPQPGCHVPATVTEEYDVAGGHVERIIGRVTAVGQRTLRYVVDSSGWYRTGVGSGCWTLEFGGFVVAPFIDFPFRREHVLLVSRTPARIILRAVSRPAAYEELDYVSPKTFFDYREVEITRSHRSAHRVYDDFTQLPSQTPRPSTPICIYPLKGGSSTR